MKIQFKKVQIKRKKIFVETHLDDSFFVFWFHDIINFYDAFMRYKWQGIAESKMCLTFDNSHKPTQTVNHVDINRMQLFLIIMRFFRSLITKNNWLNSNKRSLQDVTDA